MAIDEEKMYIQIDSPNSSFANGERLKITNTDSYAFTSQGTKPSILEASTVKVYLKQKTLDERDCPERTDIARGTIFSEIGDTTT